MASILLYGGSFNPIHHGHLICARAAAEQVGASRVVLIPAARPPHKSVGGLAAAAVRFELCRMAVVGDNLFEVSDWEIRQSGPNYTLHTVRYFRTLWPDAELMWLIGADSLADLATWYRVGELARECRLVTASRPGFETPDMGTLEALLDAATMSGIRRDVLNTPRIDISATQVRQRAAEGRSLRYLVPEGVRARIESLGLFTAPSAADSIG